MNFLIAFILTQCLQLDITLVGDISGSVDGNRHHVVEAFDGLIDRFENKDVRISIMAFGNYPYVLANYSYDSQYLKEQSQRILDIDLGASTDLTEALMMAAVNSFAGREGVRKVIIVVSDGAPNDEKTAYMTAMEIKVSPDIDLCGVYIKTEAGKPEYLRKLVSLYCYEVTTYDKLYDVLKKINLCF